MNMTCGISKILSGSPVGQGFWKKQSKSRENETYAPDVSIQVPGSAYTSSSLVELNISVRQKVSLYRVTK